MKTILMIEDNPDIMTINRIALMDNYRLLEAVNLKAGKELMVSEAPDLILLDIVLPDGNGLDFLEEIKQISNIPVLLITALDENEDIVEGLKRGGDDYIAKPYDIGVLCARVEALLRRSSGEGIQQIIKIGALEVNHTARIAMLNSRDLLLTPKELSLLELLLANAGHYCTGKELYEKAWGTESDKYSAVKLHIHNIRKKLGDDAPVTIESEKGKGYRLVIKV